MARRHGVVAEFDEGVGLGTVTTEDGSAYPFHCTQIASGSRTIPVGARVEFTVVAGHMGRWEAADIEPVTAVATAPPAEARGRP